MTYLSFLCIFLIPPIAALALTAPRPLGGRGDARGVWAIPLVMVIALIYTTPWDNYLVYRGVWWYGTERVLATIGYVPVEEYLFFVLQPIFTGLTLYHSLGRTKPRPTEAPIHRIRSYSILYFAFAITGFALLVGPEQGLYLGLILSWAAPVLGLMWVYAGPLFVVYRSAYLQTLVVATLYLWVADRIAIGLGIWDISNTYSFDWDPLGLPVEEAVFFLVTNLLVIQGTLLFLHGDRLPHHRSSSSAEPVQE